MDKIEEAPSSNIIARNIIINMAKNIDTKGRLPMFNERYLHHYFSMQVQNNNILLDICDKNIMLFPEWPTYKRSEEKENKHSFAKYKMEKNKEDTKKPSRYEPKGINGIKKEKGSAGFIDFAIGNCNYDSPEVGIEFKYLPGWDREAVTFDFLKLMDKRNPFKMAFWFGLILRKGGFSNKLKEKNFEEAFSDAITRLKSAKERLEGDWEERVSERTMFILAAEVNNDNNKRYFLCGNKDGNFRVSEHIEDYNGFKL